MLKKTKTWIIVASLFIVIGTALFTAAMSAYDWNFTRLSTRASVTRSHEVTDSFSNITVQTNTARIALQPSADGVCRVTCTDDEHVTYEVAVRDDTLQIKPMYKKKTWYDYIAITFGQSKITIELPDAVYGALTLQNDTGDVEIPRELSFESVDVTTDTGNVSLLASVLGSIRLQATTGDLLVEGGKPESLELSTTTGRITVSDVTCSGAVSIKVSTGKTLLTDLSCQSLTTTGSTGDITLKNVIAEQAFSIKRSTGDVFFERCDAAEILVKTDTGDVQGSLRTPKIFAPKTDTGKIQLPSSTDGGLCEIVTDTGDIRLDIQ